MDSNLLRDHEMSSQYTATNFQQQNTLNSHSGTNVF